MYKKELDSGKLLFVEVPNEAKGFEIVTNQSVIPYGKALNYEDKPFRGYINYCGIDLPDGNWQLLGFSTELTEEQLKDVMTKRGERYEDFSISVISSQFVYVLGTSLESFQSLKSSLGLIDENKYQSDWDELCTYGHGGFAKDGKTEIELYQEEQSKVKKLIVLFNPKK